MKNIDTPPVGITKHARNAGLNVDLLYEAVIELSNEGLLTAVCINAAAGILVAELGLPPYFFQNISKDALKNILRAVGRNILRKEGEFLLRGEPAELQLDTGSGIQVRIATAETRDRMEALLDPVMAGCCVEYYFGETNNYYTYLIRPEPCKELADLEEGDSPFAFSSGSAVQANPQKTRQRYERFLKRSQTCVTPRVEVSRSPETDETRVMFQEDFSSSALPVIRKIMEDSQIVLTRAYWEIYRGTTGQIESVCSFYLKGSPDDSSLDVALVRLRNLLATAHNPVFQSLYIAGELSFEEYVFAVNASEFVHEFIFKGSDADREVLAALDQPGLRDGMAHRILESNRNEYTHGIIIEEVCLHPELIRVLYGLFDQRFNPARTRRISSRTLAKKIDDFKRQLEILFMDHSTSLDIFSFMTRLLSNVLKTNFYLPEKRSFSFRLDATILDPLVFPSKVHGIFFIVGFYSIGTHMRADDIARGGLRLIRVTPSNYSIQLDQMLPLNYALGPVAQRLKHKDIAESGSKGVIVPFVEHAQDGLSSVFDYTEGILDLVQPSEHIVDYLGSMEMIFFGPDEGTAPFMDLVAERARKRGYKMWRTLTSGKRIGIPHDAHGLTQSGEVFSLFGRKKKGTELLLDGVSQTVSTKMSDLRKKIGSRIQISGMTTASVLASFRTVIDHLGLAEKNVNLMMTGGPDGDLGANQIQSFKGRICLLIDGGGVLFDPDGLDRNALLDLALSRHTSPRLNSMDFPDGKLGPNGFKAPGVSGKLNLPDGTQIEDGALFHRNFLTAPESRAWIEKADIHAFIPCGGFRETIHTGNVRTFLKIFRELRVIVEGANVFFDDAARRTIATETSIFQIKDSTANKGGVTCSSLGEILPAILLGSSYEKTLLENPKTQISLISDMFETIQHSAAAETQMLLSLHEREGTPLYELSVQTSEQMLELQEELMKQRSTLLRQKAWVDCALKAYVPATLQKVVGMEKIRKILARPELIAYRDAIITKQLASMALYRYADDWDAFLERMNANASQTIHELVMKGSSSLPN